MFNNKEYGGVKMNEAITNILTDGYPCKSKKIQKMMLKEGKECDTWCG